MHLGSSTNLLSVEKLCLDRDRMGFPCLIAERRWSEPSTLQVVMTLQCRLTYLLGHAQEGTLCHINGKVQMNSTESGRPDAVSFPMFVQLECQKTKAGPWNQIL